MNTVVLYGSPRNNGNTNAMLNSFLKDVKGEIYIVDSYSAKVSPCNDCHYCWSHNACVIKDDMTMIYEKVYSANNLVIASPIYFNSLPGSLKNIIDRFQVSWSSRKRKDSVKSLPKKGALLFCGGAPAYENQFFGAELIAKGLFKELNVVSLGAIAVPNTDKFPIYENKIILNKANEFGMKFNIL